MARCRPLWRPSIRERGRALGGAASLGHQRIDDQTVAVLHQEVAHVAELGLLAVALAHQPRVGVGGRGMGRVAAPVGGLRKTRHRGRAQVGWLFTLTAAACNLVRLPKLLAAG